jgi:hypothetical protein
MSDFLKADGKRANRRGMLLAWRVARKSFLAADRDPELAKKLAEDELNSLAIPPIVMQIILSIIVKLIVEWIKDNYLTPSETPVLLAEDELDDE